MNNPPIAFALAVLLALCGCGSAASDAGEPPLAGARIGGPFTLTDQDGRRVGDGAFAGRYRIVYFGYTYCPDICPVDLQKLMQGLKAFEAEAPARAAKVQPLFITVDPARDTPAAIKQYVAAFHPRLIGLTGSEAEIAATAKAYAIYYRRAETPGASDYLMDHSRQALLFGPKGEPIALLPQDGSAQAIAAELGKWVS